MSDAISNLILSPSGWRGVFAEDGIEESLSGNISPAHKVILAAAAQVFADYLVNKKGAIIVGRDTRPTGEVMADAIILALLSLDREVWYTGIVAAPEIMAFAKSKEHIAAGFIYISASHNPIGHNGIKFGLTDGGVLKAEEAVKLSSAFLSFIESSDNESSDNIERIKAIFRNDDNERLLSHRLSDVYSRQNSWKNEALSAYRKLTEEVISGFTDTEKIDSFFNQLKSSIQKRPIGLVADFNGSARAVSIDKDFFSSLGLGFTALNEIPGKIVNRIVPEGESLEPCKGFLKRNNSNDPSFIIGYMSDCDGDRGNLVFMEVSQDRKREARILEAQEVFALACIAELSSLVRNGELKLDNNGKAVTKTALVANDPTSIRIDRIASSFGASVFRAEVGEANVVGLARRLREQGYLVKILGEGSNGGMIIHPSAVRDPINTLGAILKLFVIRDGVGEGYAAMGLFEIWCSLSGQKYPEDFSLADIMASLPAFSTTGVASEEAKLKVKPTDHALLKDIYQKIFIRKWEEKKTWLFEQFGFSDWEAIAYNGMEERRSIKHFADAGRGGLKIEFSGKGEKNAFIWMRGSGTEPVFRIIADAEGRDPQLERFLIDWQRQMVLEANRDA